MCCLREFSNFVDTVQARRLVFAWVGSFSLKTDIYVKLTFIAEDFPVEVDGGVAEHNSLLQCPMYSVQQGWHSWLVRGPGT